jgi:hypothetical protein
VLEGAARQGQRWIIISLCVADGHGTVLYCAGTVRYGMARARRGMVKHGTATLRYGQGRRRCGAVAAQYGTARYGRTVRYDYGTAQYSTARYGTA